MLSLKRNSAPFLWNGCAVLAEYARTDFKGVIKESVLLFLAALMLAVPAMHVQAAQTDGANDSLRKVKVGYLIYQGYQEGEDDAPESGYGYEYLQQIAYYAGWEYELVFYCIAYQQLVQWINFDKSPLCGSVIW